MGLTRKQMTMIVIMVIGTFVAILNQTLMTPALPTIMAEMNVDTSTVQWLTTGFTLVNAVMIPVTAFLIDRFSVRGLFACSMFIFGCGSALAGIAPNFAVLLIGRLVQAGGAGIMSPLVMTVLLQTFPVERRGSAMGLFGLVIAFAPAVGPTCAGIVVDNIGWRFLFYAIALLAAIVVIASLIALRGDESERKKVKLSLSSVVLSTVGFGALLYGLSVIGSDGIGIPAIAGIVIGVVVLVVFFWRQIVMDEPMLQVRVLTNRRFLISVIIVMLVQMSLMGGTVLTPILMQTDLGFTATQSGLVVLPGALITAVMSPISGRLFDKYGPRVLGIIGLAVTTLGTFLFAIVDSSATLTWLMVVYTVRMFGMSLVNMPINTWGMNALPNNLINHGTSVVNTFRQVAGSFGTAILVSVYSIVMAGSTSSLGEIQASIHGFNVAFAVSTVLCLIGLVMTIVLVNDKPVKAKARKGASVEPIEESPLESIMNREVYCIPDSYSVLEATQEMVDRGINGAPIVDADGNTLGFVSDGDVIRYLSHNSTEITDVNTMITYMLRTGSENEPIDTKIDDLLQMNVKGIASKKIVSVDINADLIEVCRTLAAFRMKKLPVLRDGVIVGIVSRTDVLAYALKRYRSHHEMSLAKASDAPQALVEQAKRDVQEAAVASEQAGDKPEGAGD